MALYLARAKYSNAAFKGMVDSPQDREAAARKIFEAVGMTMQSPDQTKRIGDTQRRY